MVSVCICFWGLYGCGKGHWNTERKIRNDGRPCVWSPPLFPLLLKDLTQGEVTLESSRGEGCPFNLDYGT